MKAWLKGGLIGLGVWVVLMIIFAIFGAQCLTQDGLEGAPIGFSCLTLVQKIVKDITDSLSFNFLSIPGHVNFYSFIFFFLWGAVIGWIVGKMKAKGRKR